MKNYINEIVSADIKPNDFSAYTFLHEKNGNRYVVRALKGDDDVVASMGLQRRVIDAMKPEDRCKIIERTATYFERMQGEVGITLGIENSEGKLVAHGVMALPYHYSTETFGRGEFELPDGVRKISQVGILQAMHCDPTEEGLGHAGRLVDARLALLKSTGRTHAICKITPKNAKSYAMYDKRGAFVFSLDYEEKDKTFLLGIHKPLAAEYCFNLAENPKIFNIKEDFENIRSLLARVPKGDGGYTRNYVGRLIEDGVLALHRVYGLTENGITVPHPSVKSSMFF